MFGWAIIHAKLSRMGGNLAIAEGRPSNKGIIQAECNVLFEGNVAWRAGRLEVSPCCMFAGMAAVLIRTIAALWLTGLEWYVADLPVEQASLSHHTRLVEVHSLPYGHCTA